MTMSLSCSLISMTLLGYINFLTPSARVGTTKVAATSRASASAILLASAAASSCVGVTTLLTLTAKITHYFVCFVLQRNPPLIFACQKNASCISLTMSSHYQHNTIIIIKPIKQRWGGGGGACRPVVVVVPVMPMGKVEVVVVRPVTMGR